MKKGLKGRREGVGERLPHGAESDGRPWIWQFDLLLATKAEAAEAEPQNIWAESLKLQNFAFSISQLSVISLGLFFSTHDSSYCCSAS